MNTSTLKEPYILVFERHYYDDVYRITYEFFKTEADMRRYIKKGEYGEIDTDLIHFFGKLCEATFFNE